MSNTTTEAAQGAAPLDIRSHRTQRETQRIEGAAPRSDRITITPDIEGDARRITESLNDMLHPEGAAPRAEGLERAALGDAIWAYMEDRGEDEHSALNAAHRAFIARLSRPFDERPWLTIHGVEQPHRGNGLPDHIPGTYEGRCPQCPSDERVPESEEPR